MPALAVVLLIIGALLLLVTGGLLLGLGNRRAWHRRHATVLREWRRHTRGNLDLILLYPALNLPTQQRTATFFAAEERAFTRLDRPGYHAAVRNLEYAYDLAIKGAHRHGRNVLPAMEREEHRYAVDLRITAQDPHLPTDVRTTALRKALDVLVRIDQLDQQTAADLYQSEAAALGPARSGTGGNDQGRPSTRQLHC